MIQLSTVMEDVVVIGGGIAGLTTAYRLLTAGRRVRCLEAEAVTGGCVRTDRVEEYVCERGAQNFLEQAGGPVHRLAGDLGIGDRITPAKELGSCIAWGNRAWSMPRQVHRVVSLRGLARAALDLCLPRGGGRADESLAAWARRRFGTEVALRLVDPVVSGIFAGDPERLSVDAALPSAVELERRHRSVILGAIRSKAPRRRVHTFKNGMATLPEALASMLGGALHVGTEAVRLSEAGDGGYKIETRDALSRAAAGALRARKVVVATPAPGAAALLLQLDATLAARLKDIPYCGLVSAWLAFQPGDFTGSPPRGYGVVRPHCQGSRVLGCIFCSSCFEAAAPGQRVLIRAMFGGRRDAEAMSLGEEDLVALALEEFVSILGLRRGARPAFVRVIRQRPGLPQYELGHARRLEEIEARLGGLKGLHLIGNAYRGVPVPSVIEQADRCARDVLGALGRVRG